MAVTLKLKPNPKRVLDDDTLPEYLRSYLAIKYAADRMCERVGEMKATLMEYLAYNGIENQNGHRILDVEDVATIIRERRISEDFLEDEATRWLTKQGRRDEVIHEVTIEEFDYDAFMALLFKEQIDQAVVDEFYERNETFAFKVRVH